MILHSLVDTPYTTVQSAIRFTSEYLNQVVFQHTGQSTLLYIAHRKVVYISCSSTWMWSWSYYGTPVCYCLTMVGVLSSCDLLAVEYFAFQKDSVSICIVYQNGCIICSQNGYYRVVCRSHEPQGF